MSGVIALIVAVTGLVAAVTGLIALFRKVQQVHVLVNSNMQELDMRVTQLTAALTQAGVDVPKPPGQGEAGERLAP